MIGKIYRPLQILNIDGKRGFKVLHKYKSNFGGTKEFSQEIYLVHNYKEKVEKIVMEFKGLEIPIMVKSFTFIKNPQINEVEITTEKGKRISRLNFDADIDDSVPQNAKNIRITTLRKLVRPNDILAKEKLGFSFIISSPDDETENDVLVVEMHPEIIEKKEYMLIETTSKTPVLVISKAGVINI